MAVQLSDTIEWYAKNKYKYNALCNVIKNLVEKLLIKNTIDFQNISCRAKEIESFSKKCNKNKYINPKDEIMDMAGIRIIAYIDSDVEKISKILETEFEIDTKNSVNKSKLLGDNQVGYRSVHYIATLPDKRLELSEYEEFKGMKFEIQVRTILQHAWAEIEHDRNYKFNGVLPLEIKRRFNLAAGVLELIDREFEKLSKDIDDYAKLVEYKTKQGKLNIPLNSTSILEYMSTKFKNTTIEKTLNGGDKAVIGELKKMGITTLAELDAIIQEDMLEKLDIQRNGTNYLGILRDIMIIYDANRYFESAWCNHWHDIEENLEYLKHFGINISDLVKKYKIDIMDEDDDIEIDDEDDNIEIYD